MKCQVTRSRSGVALSGQFLVRTRRVPGGEWGRMGRWSDGGSSVSRSGQAAGAALAREWGGRTGALAGAGLRVGLTGRNVCLAGFPGFYPGLVELALQAGIAVLAVRGNVDFGWCFLKHRRRRAHRDSGVFEVGLAVLLTPHPWQGC
jgi:hypothetical protein